SWCKPFERCCASRRIVRGPRSGLLNLCDLADILHGLGITAQVAVIRTNVAQSMPTSHLPAQTAPGLCSRAGGLTGTARGGYKGFSDKRSDFMRTEALVATDPTVCRPFPGF